MSNLHVFPHWILPLSVLSINPQALPLWPASGIALYMYAHTSTSSTHYNSTRSFGLQIPPVSVHDPAHSPGSISDLHETSHYQEVVTRRSTKARAVTGILTMWNICNLLYFSIFYQNVSQSQQIFAMVTGSLAVEQCQRQFLASDSVAASTSGTCTFVHVPLLCRLLLSPFSITFIPQTRSLQFARRVIPCMYIYFLACEDSTTCFFCMISCTLNLLGAVGWLLCFFFLRVTLPLASLSTRLLHIQCSS